MKAMFASYDKKKRKERNASLPDQLYVVQLADPPHTVLKGLPTPMLIQAGEADAWMQHEGVWRMREDQYDPEGTTYTKVRVFRNPNR